MTLIVNSWQDKARSRALTMANEIIENFNEKLQGSSVLLPNTTNVPDRNEMMNIFMDALLGATVQCISTVTMDCSNQMEKAVAEAIRAKFKWLRKELPTIAKVEVEDAN